MPFLITPFLVIGRLLLPVAPQEQTEVITVTRLADEVVVYSAQLGMEKRLYYWDKRYNIAQGDELRQGSSAISEIRFADGTLIRSFHGATIRAAGFEGGVRTIILKAVFSSIVELGTDRSRLRLPGGAFFEGAKSHLTIDQRDEAAWILKNSGPEVVKLEGLPRTAGVTELQAGYQIVIPNLPPLDRGPTGTIHEDVLSGLRVQTGDGVRVEHSPVGMVLSGTGPGDGLADIGGARILVVEGFELHLARVARPMLPATEPVTEPAVKEPPAAEPKKPVPAEPDGPPAPADGDPVPTLPNPPTSPAADEAEHVDGPPLPDDAAAAKAQSDVDEGPPIEDNEPQPPPADGRAQENGSS